MTDEETVEQPESEKKAPLAGKKRLMIIGIVVAVQIPLVILIGNKLIKPRLVDQETVTTEVAEVGRGTIMMLEDITVNLLGTKRPRFLRVSIGLELENEQVTAEIEERQPEIRDVVISSVSGRRVDQLISVEGKEHLKKELKDRIDSTLQQGSVLKVYFSDFVVQ